MTPLTWSTHSKSSLSMIASTSSCGNACAQWFQRDFRGRHFWSCHLCLTQMLAKWLTVLILFCPGKVPTPWREYSQQTGPIFHLKILLNCYITRYTIVKSTETDLEQFIKTNVHEHLSQSH